MTNEIDSHEVNALESRHASYQQYEFKKLDHLIYISAVEIQRTLKNPGGHSQTSAKCHKFPDKMSAILRLKRKPQNVI